MYCNAEAREKRGGLLFSTWNELFLHKYVHGLKVVGETLVGFCLVDLLRCGVNSAA